jgi:hypothetical protein
MPDEETRARLAARHVTIEVAPIVGLEGEAPGLAGVRLADGRLVEIVALYLAPRTSFQSPIAEQLGSALDDGAFAPVIQTDATKMTSIPGVGENVNLRESCEDGHCRGRAHDKNTKSPYFRDALPVLIATAAEFRLAPCTI